MNSIPITPIVNRRHRRRILACVSTNSWDKAEDTGSSAPTEPTDSSPSSVDNQEYTKLGLDNEERKGFKHFISPNNQSKNLNTCIHSPPAIVDDFPQHLRRSLKENGYFYNRKNLSLIFNSPDHILCQRAILPASLSSTSTAPVSITNLTSVLNHDHSISSYETTFSDTSNSEQVVASSLKSDGLEESFTSRLMKSLAVPSQEDPSVSSYLFSENKFLRKKNNHSTVYKQLSFQEIEQTESNLEASTSHPEQKMNSSVIIYNHKSRSVTNENVDSIYVENSSLKYEHPINVNIESYLLEIPKVKQKSSCADIILKEVESKKEVCDISISYTSTNTEVMLHESLTNSELSHLLFVNDEDSKPPHRIVIQVIQDSTIVNNDRDRMLLKDTILLSLSQFPSEDDNVPQWTTTILSSIRNYYDQLLFQLRKYIPVIVLHDPSYDSSLSITVFNHLKRDGVCSHVYFVSAILSQLQIAHPRAFISQSEKIQMLNDNNKLQCRIKILHNFLFQKIGSNAREWIQVRPPSRITSYLYLGCARNSTNKDELQSLSVYGIINAARECENYFPSDFEYMNLNLDDEPEENIFPFFENTFQFIERIRRCGKAIFVHCFVGASRSVAIIIAYIMRKKKWTFQKSYRYLLSKRQETDVNYGFCEQLMEYEKVLLNR